MADFEQGSTGLTLARIRRSEQVQRAQMMVLAAGIASLSIVAVAAAMMTTLF